MTRIHALAHRLALALALALAVILLWGPGASWAASSGSINSFAAQQRAAAGAPALKANAGLTATATRAAVASASSGALQAPSGIPSGYTSTQTVMKSLTTSDPGATYQRAAASSGGVMNSAAWTDMGTGFATGGGKTYLILIYASYPPTPKAPVADPEPAPAPKAQAPSVPKAQPQPAPKVEVQPAPAPVAKAPAPQPKATPKPKAQAPAPAATPKATQKAKTPTPKATAKPSAKPKPSTTPTPSASPTPSATPEVGTRTVVQEVKVPAISEAQRHTAGMGMLGGGGLSALGSAFATRRWKRLKGSEPSADPAAQ